LDLHLPRTGSLRRAGLAIGVMAALVVPATASAATKTVIAGPLKEAKGVFGGNATGDVDGYSLNTVTIHVGDKVRWKFNGFHTVTFPKKGGTVPFAAPDPSVKYTGFNDAAGAPFWFNGQAQLDLNPLGVLPVAGKTEDGSAIRGSGAPLSGSLKPYTLKFPKAGTFTYICVVHPGMKAKVKVVPKGTAIPSTKVDSKTAATLFASEVKSAKKLAKLKPATNTVQGGSDKLPVVQLRFFPQTVHIPTGGTLTLQVKSLPEVHTFSFGPAKFLQDTAAAFAGPTAGGAFAFSPLVVFPTDPPPALPAYDGTAHGNGFFSTGLLDGDPNSPSPSSAKVTFSKAGTYDFICLIHPFMHGQVVVG
jgi:plastocyanin